VNVAVVGVGSMGSAVADMSARYGVEKLTLIDPDGLSQENVKRHILTRTSVGKLKVMGMESHLLMASEKAAIVIQVRPFDPKMFSEPPDIIACCADSDACCQLVNQYCVENRIPCVWGGVHGAAEAAEVITYVPGFPCYACYEREGELPAPSQEKYTNPNYDPTQTPHQEGLWCDVLVAASMTFRAMLAVREGRPLP
jgi:molybdopterin/thiamine biosynthesis adenylyltransferase